MNRPQHAAEPGEISLVPEDGWHCLHVYYEFQAVLARLSPGDDVRQEVMGILNPEGDGAPQRLQTSVVSGHKADFSLMIMDPDPLVCDRVHQRLLSSSLGPALHPTYSFVSVTEVSEYVPTLEQYGERLVREGEEQGSDAYEAKLRAYAAREPMMRKQRLTPDFPRVARPPASIP